VLKHINKKVPLVSHTELEIWTKPNISPPGTVSLIGGKFTEGGKFPR